jgi:cytochrome c556
VVSVEAAQVGIAGARRNSKNRFMAFCSFLSQMVLLRFSLWMLAAGLLLLGTTRSQGQASDSMANMPGMDKNDMADMKDMGPSMAAMAGHMYVTPLRPRQPGDEEKAKAIVAQVRASIERYRDYKKALADGYVIANPEVDQPQAHFNNKANLAAAEHHFDPTKPSSLLYFKTPKQHYKLEGVMFTAAPNATEDELNERIPLSVVRWHFHEKFCAAPASRTQEYLGQHPKFGMFGSINTADACKAEGGTFLPRIFTWMIHVFPFEEDLKDAYSMNDDVSHFGLQP